MSVTVHRRPCLPCSLVQILTCVYFRQESRFIGVEPGFVPI